MSINFNVTRFSQFYSKQFFFSFLFTAGYATEELDGACQALARRLEVELRAAKHAQLACGEVLLPADLLPKIAEEVLAMAENEPCGLR